MPRNTSNVSIYIPDEHNETNGIALFAINVRNLSDVSSTPPERVKGIVIKHIQEALSVLDIRDARVEAREDIDDTWEI